MTPSPLTEILFQELSIDEGAPPVPVVAATSTPPSLATLSQVKRYAEKRGYNPVEVFRAGTSTRYSLMSKSEPPLVSTFTRSRDGLVLCARPRPSVEYEEGGSKVSLNFGLEWSARQRNTSSEDSEDKVVDFPTEDEEALNVVKHMRTAHDDAFDPGDVTQDKSDHGWLGRAERDWVTKCREVADKLPESLSGTWQAGIEYGQMMRALQ